MIKKEELIFVIRKHPQIGCIIEPSFIEIMADGEFSLRRKRVNTKLLSDYTKQVTDIELKMIKLLEELADEPLVKRFSKKATRPTDFFSTLNEKNLNLVVKPFVDLKMNAALVLAKEHAIDFYLEQDSSRISSYEKIKILPHFAELLTKFKREEGTTYSLKLIYDNQEILLNHPNSCMLTNKPGWLLVKDKIVQLTAKQDGKRVLPFLQKESLFIPPSSEELYYAGFLLNSLKSEKVQLEGIELHEFKHELKPWLVVEDALKKHLVLRLSFWYGNVEVKPSSSQKFLVFFKKESFSFEKTYRNQPEEQKVLNYLSSIGLINLGDDTFCWSDVQTDQDLFSRINTMQLQIESKGIHLKSDLSKSYFLGEINLEFETIASKNDWFDVYGKVKFGTIEVPFIKLRKHILENIREYELPTGEIVVLPPEWFIKFQTVFQLAKIENTTLKIRKTQSGLFKHLDDSFYKQHQFDKTTFFESVKNTTPPKQLEATLRPYQLKGYAWLKHIVEKNQGGCLADDMGLGKTIQVIALLCYLKEQNIPLETTLQLPNEPNQLSLFESEKTALTANRNVSLVVVPLSLIYNWKSELQKFAPHLRYYIHLGQDRAQKFSSFQYYDVVLTTYGILRNDTAVFADGVFSLIVLDESQVIKNISSQNYKAVSLLKGQAKIILTGTPIENSLMDIWGQFNFLNEGLLGGHHFFKKYFATPIEKGKDETRLLELHHLIEGVLLRRTKRDVAPDLPALSINTFYCSMTESQRLIYEAEKSAIRNSIIESIHSKGKNQSAVVILNGLLKLRQLANHPKLYDDAFSDISGKFEDVMENIRRLQSEKHKVLLFSSFVKYLDLFKDQLKQEKIGFAYLTGEITGDKRQQVINDFQNKDSLSVFLISLKAGGVGLNLTAADYVFIIDPWWNPAAELQAINRSHRIGQNNQVFAYKFITKDSVEEKILVLQEKKKFLMDEMMENKNPFQHLTENEITELFS